MKKFYLIIFSCFLACQINAQFPAPYCAEIFPTNVEPITEIFFNSLINTTSEVVNGTPAHENFTSLSSGIFHRGETHFLSVQGNTNGNFSHYIRAFIDWNNDNDFLDVNESYDVGILTNSTGIDGLEVIANITIPYDITDGIKRMRITKKLNSYALPCNTTGSGQAEDYTINIVSSVAPYCENNFPDEVDPITRVTFAHLSNISNNVINSSPPHENFTDKKAFVQAGFTYPIEVSANTAGNYTNYVRLFVDWNNDYDFLDANESYDVGTITNSTGIDGIFVTANIAIPASATLGDHRMRVTQRYFSYAPPCNTVGYGQAEDYTIQVFSLSPYCTNDYTDTITPITRVTFSGIDIISNPIINVTPPHEDFTYVEGVVMPDSIYTIKVQGNTEGAFTDYIRVFIDWNNDYDFLDANESYDIGTITNSTGQDGIEVVGTITVPNGTVLGNKRMRITKKRSSYSASCETAGYGQMEDYTLKVVNNIKAIIAGGNTYLQGNYVEVGISQCGTFGTTGAAPQGYHARSGNTQIRVGDGPANLGFVADPSMDGWTVGSPYKYHGDYFMPASPYVGFAISHNGINNTNERAESSNATCGSFLNTTTTPFSGNNLSAFNNTTVSRGTWEGLNDGLKVQKITTVKQDKVYFTVKVKMYNTTALPISGVYYGDYVNPDNDAYENDILNPGNLLTTNSIIYQNPADGKSLVQAIGANGLQSYLGLGSKDCRSKVFKCVNPSPNYNTAIEMYNGTGPNPLDFTGTDASAANRFIGIAFNIGTIAAGDSTSFIYTYILKASDFEDALAETDPTFNFNGNETPTGGTITPCANTTNTIILNDADGYNWTWSPATGLNTTTGKQVNITVTTTPITYTVTGVSSGGCSNKIVTLNVEPVNITDIVLPSVVTKCETGAPLLLSATGGAFTNAIIYNESFNGEGNNWNKFNNTTGGIAANAAWTLRPNGYSYSVDVFNTNDNSQFYLSNSDAAGPANITATILQSPAISTINYASATVSFNHYLREPSTGSSTALVQASVDGVLWTTLQTYTSTQGSAASFAAVSIPLTAPFLNQSTVYIRFKYDGIYRWYWAINDIKITGSGQPIVWSPTTNLFTDAAGTIPYTGGIATSVFANPTSLTVYTAASTTGICSKSSNITVTLSPINTTIAGAVSAIQCESKIVNALGSIYLNTA
ncbi:MAG: hypothetical protein KA319_14130, partial [Ferruginibacter sp.]|nr:hypothetical protein [Ferruginibacter sp.]